MIIIHEFLSNASEFTLSLSAAESHPHAAIFVIFTPSRALMTFGYMSIFKLRCPNTARLLCNKLIFNQTLQ